jgi:hypothetical protein
MPLRLKMRRAPYPDGYTLASPLTAALSKPNLHPENRPSKPNPQLENRTIETAPTPGQPHHRSQDRTLENRTIETKRLENRTIDPGIRTGCKIAVVDDTATKPNLHLRKPRRGERSIAHGVSRRVSSRIRPAPPGA